MTTMADAIREYVESQGKRVGSDEIKAAVMEKYPNKWRPTTLQTHLYGCVVNNPKGYLHHPNAKKFLSKNSDGSFEIYSEENIALMSGNLRKGKTKYIWYRKSILDYVL